MLPSFSEDPITGARGPGGQLLATPLRRVLAYVLDTIIVIVLTNALWIVVDRLTPSSPSDGGRILAGARWIVDEPISVLYFVGLWTGGRRTLGMSLFGIRVVRSADGGPVRVLPALGRWLVLELAPIMVFAMVLTLPTDLWFDGLAALPLGIFVTFVPWFIWPLILLASVVRHPMREGLHDRFARTAVVADRR